MKSFDSPAAPVGIAPVAAHFLANDRFARIGVGEPFPDQAFHRSVGFGNEILRPFRACLDGAARVEETCREDRGLFDHGDGAGKAVRYYTRSDAPVARGRPSQFLKMAIVSVCIAPTPASASTPQTASGFSAARLSLKSRHGKRRVC